MARIPDTEIERLKNEVSVERLVEASGVELKKAGKDMDANEYALKMQPADKALGLLIRKAVWMGNGAAPKRNAVEHLEVTACDLKPSAEPEVVTDRDHLPAPPSLRASRSQQE